MSNRDLLKLFYLLIFDFLKYLLGGYNKVNNVELSVTQVTGNKILFLDS